MDFGRPSISGGIEVIPILAKGVENGDASKKPGDSRTSISLIQASKEGLVRVMDSAGGSRVTMENLAKVPLVVLAGEYLKGGHQDQITGQDYVIMPKQKVAVDVYCVEPLRGSGTSSMFAVDDTIVPDRIRKILLAVNLHELGRLKAQNMVWAEVAKINQSQARSSPTGTLGATVDDSYVRESLDQIAARINANLDDSDQAVGMMFCIKGKVFSTDIFATHQLFDEFRLPLLRMYALSALIEPVPNGELEIGACADFLEPILVARRILMSKGIGGALYSVSAPGAYPVEIGLSDLALPSGFVHGLYIPRK